MHFAEEWAAGRRDALTEDCDRQDEQKIDEEKLDSVSQCGNSRQIALSEADLKIPKI